MNVLATTKLAIFIAAYIKKTQIMKMRDTTER